MIRAGALITASGRAYMFGRALNDEFYSVGLTWIFITRRCEGSQDGLVKAKISMILRNDNIILRNDKPFFEENPYLCSVLIDK